MREIDTLAVNAQSNEQSFNQLLTQQEFYILKCASKVTHRYITKSDDEWSIALLAFSQAVKSYSLEKGSFLSFAELIINRRLIDYIRSLNKTKYEVSVDPIIFNADPEEDDTNLSLRLSVAEQISVQKNDNLTLEIDAANHIFQKYGFSFFDLTSCSPQAKKTKSACAKAINYMLDNPILITELRNTKQLPLKVLEKTSKVPRKILERHRKYIIAVIEILSGEYPNLADYLRYIREENTI